MAIILGRWSVWVLNPKHQRNALISPWRSVKGDITPRYPKRLSLSAWKRTCSHACSTLFLGHFGLVSPQNPLWALEISRSEPWPLKVRRLHSIIEYHQAISPLFGSIPPWNSWSPHFSISPFCPGVGFKEELQARQGIGQCQGSDLSAAVTWLETFGTHLHCWLE